MPTQMNGLATQLTVSPLPMGPKPTVNAPPIPGGSCTVQEPAKEPRVSARAFVVVEVLECREPTATQPWPATQLTPRSSSLRNVRAAAPGRAGTAADAGAASRAMATARPLAATARAEIEPTIATSWPRSGHKGTSGTATDTRLSVHAS